MHYTCLHLSNTFARSSHAHCMHFILMFIFIFLSCTSYGLYYFDLICLTCYPMSCTPCTLYTVHDICLPHILLLPSDFSFYIHSIIHFLSLCLCKLSLVCPLLLLTPGPIMKDLFLVHDSDNQVLHFGCPNNDIACP